MKKTMQLYGTVWRWHFYAGIFCIPFLLMLAATGAVYLFKPQIDAWVERPYSNLRLSGERASPQQHIAAAEHATGGKFMSYRLPQTPKQAVVVSVRANGERQLVYVHPHNLEVLKTVAYNGQFIRMVRSLHGELLLGNSGAVLVELAGCWAIVLIITGLYLWWPRRANGLSGVLFPRLRRGSRIFWRDMHAVTGFWIALFTLFLLITGLPWALVWGSAFKEARSMFEQRITQDWVVNEHAAHSSVTSDHVALTTQVVERAALLGFAPPVEITADKSQIAQWKISSQHQNRPMRSDAWLNERGQIIKKMSFSDRKPIDKAIGVGIAAHEGQLFGWLNQLLGLVVVFGVGVVSVTGFVLWRKRKPQGVLGAPPLRNTRLGAAVVVITVLLGVLLPLLGASLIVLWLLEKFVLSRFIGVRSWLGIATPE